MDTLSRREVLASGGAVALLYTGLGGCGGERGGEQVTDTREASVVRIPLEGASPIKSSNLTIPYIDVMGRGFDSAANEQMGELATGKIVETPLSEGSEGNGIRYEFAEKQEQYYSLRRMSAKAKGSYGAFSAKGSVSTAHEQSSNSYALHVCAVCVRRDKQIVFDKSTLSFADAARREVRKNWQDHAMLVRSYGDSYVHSVKPEAHLFVDLIFQTASESQRREIQASLKASYAKLVSGKASYSEVVQSASNSKNVGIEITGFRGSLEPSKIGVEEIDRIVKEFFEGADKGATLGDIEIRPVRELKLNDQSPGWVNPPELVKRQQFFNNISKRMIQLDQREADALYVRNNPEEFAADVIAKAADNIEKIANGKDSLEQIGKVTYAEWLRDGVTGNRFDIERISGLKSATRNYEKYPRKA